MTSETQQELNKRFLEAVSVGSTSMAEKMLEMGANLDCRGQFGRNALHIAASNNLDLTVEYLLKRGMDAGVLDDTGETAVQLAVRDNSGMALVTFAEKKKWDVMDRPSPADGRTPLMQAIEWEKWRAANALITEGANLDLADKDGKTALMLAAEKGNINAVSKLLVYGADAAKQCNDEFTALHYARLGGNAECIALLEVRLGDVEREMIERGLTEGLSKDMRRMRPLTLKKGTAPL